MSVNVPVLHNSAIVRAGNRHHAIHVDTPAGAYELTNIYHAETGVVLI